MDAKAYLRKAFESGFLDVTDSYEAVRDFVIIFAGERVAHSAIRQCRFLTYAQREKLEQIAANPRLAAEMQRSALNKLFGTG